ncbi:MAG: hypothetical protein OEV94_04920 [Deltaproteobacteria bacterium]|nr:hypothetical protein [Deltaproteobacteria bacterium]
MSRVQIHYDKNKLTAFCERWKMLEMSFWGVVLQPGFMPGQPVQMVIAYRPNVKWKLSEELTMVDELVGVLGQPVDIQQRNVVEANPDPAYRDMVLGDLETVYEM